MDHRHVRGPAAVYVREAPGEEGAGGHILEACYHYLAVRGLDVAALYIDEGVAGSVPFGERRWGGEVLKDAAAGHFRLLVIYQYSQLARDVKKIATTVGDLDELGVAVVAVAPEMQVIPMEMTILTKPPTRQRERAVRLGIMRLLTRG